MAQHPPANAVQPAHRQGALIIGASSGIGASLARVLAQRGYAMALVARREDALTDLASSLNSAAGGAENARAYVHDVRDVESAPELYQRILADFSSSGVSLDLVVYASGLMIGGHTGPWNFEDERATIETNVIGAMRWLGLAAATFAAQGYGTLAGISSVAGDRGRKGNSAYMASKAALSTYLESLHYRLADRGVRVITIKPGLVATPMTAGQKTSRLLTARPESVARRIADACERGSMTVYVPGFWSLIMRVIRMLPASVMARLSI